MRVPISFSLHRSTKGSKGLSVGNEMINANDRLHFRTKAALTDFLRQKATETAMEILGNLQEPLFTEEHPCCLFVEVCPPSNRRMDTPNWYPTVKALIDGLVDAKVLSDDNDKIIRSTTFLPRGHCTPDKQYQVHLIFCDKESLQSEWNIL